MASKVYTTKELAEKLEVEPVTLRRFLRATDEFESPGKGGRYRIEAKRFRTLRAQFLRWKEEHTRVA